MKRSRSALAIASTLLLALGVGASGYAGYQIISMNMAQGSDYLPKIAPLVPTQEVPRYVTPHVGSVFASLSIPRLKKVFPIVEGTETSQLKKGIGHYLGSVLPGFADNSVLAGHRDSYFRNLGQIKIGDLMTVTTDWGVFVYEVHRIRIVKADDKTVIVPTPNAVLTLSTCYPFRFIGNAPKRYIVQAGLVIGEALH